MMALKQLLLSLGLFSVLLLVRAVEVLANGDHGDDVAGGMHFNPIAFGIVTAALVVVAYFLYRIFAGSGKKSMGE